MTSEKKKAGLGKPASGGDERVTRMLQAAKGRGKYRLLKMALVARERPEKKVDFC